MKLILIISLIYIKLLIFNFLNTINIRYSISFIKKNNLSLSVLGYYKGFNKGSLKEKKFKNRKSLRERNKVKNYSLYKNEEVILIKEEDYLFWRRFKECRFQHPKTRDLLVNGALCGLSHSGDEIIHHYVRKDI